MEPTINLNEAVDNPRSRRALLAGVLGGLGAWLVSAAQRAMPAEASAGDPVLAGRSNSGGGFSTELRANTGKTVFKAVNAGGGDGLRGVATTGRGVVGIGREGIGVVAQTLNNVGLWAEAHHGGTAINANASRSATAIVASHRAHSGVAFRTHGKSIFDGQVQVGRLFLAGIANGAPPPGGAKLLVKSNSSGKTQLCVRFNTGVIQVLATET
jgi:hypothetical protein